MKRLTVLIGAMAALLALAVGMAGAQTKKVNPVVVLETSKGNIEIELNPDKAPITVQNFLWYVDNKFYDGLIFHRVIADFMVQGGGFTPEMSQKTGKPRPSRTRPATVSPTTSTPSPWRARTWSTARPPSSSSIRRQRVLEPQEQDAAGLRLLRVRQGREGHGRGGRDRQGQDGDQERHERRARSRRCRSRPPTARKPPRQEVALRQDRERVSSRRDPAGEARAVAR